MTPKGTRSTFPRAVLQLMSFGLLWVGACTSELESPAGPNTGEGDQCLSNRDFFAQEAWTQVFGKTCITCHAPGGVAAESEAAFKLLPASYPGFVDANLAAVTEMARNEFDGVPLLLAKPSGKTKHGGGTVLKEDDPAYAVVEELITRLRDGDPCPLTFAPPDFQGVMLLDARETYRKATLHLVGRLPKGEELEQLDKAKDEALEPLLDKLMTEDAFYERLKEMFNDIFLSDRYFPGTRAVDLLDENAYPRAGDWFDEQPEELQEAINRALAREPLELIAFIVRTGKPFTEVLTANYTVVNPYSAQLYGITPEFEDVSDEAEWAQAKIPLVHEGRKVRLPHAGVLSNPMWLNRFPTSETNRNRHRARMVMQQFLATDILSVAERPVDAVAAAKYNNPTRDDPACASCHRQLDPVAGAFMKWDDDDQEEFAPDREWHRDMFAPGFSDELMPVAEYDSALSWLSNRIVKDPRFVLSIVRHMYSALTGHEPLEYPSVMLTDYEATLSAWEAQERAFRATAQAFVQQNYDLRVVLKRLVLSPYFRAENLDADAPQANALALQDVGTGRLTIPELLDRKIKAVVGFYWTRDWDRQPYLRGDYQVMYGGIDSDNITVRLSDVNSVMSGVQWRMANEVACTAASWEMSRARNLRTLLKYVDVDTTPVGEDGADDPEAIAAIKKNIRYLHERFWGARVAVDDPEIATTYELFVQTWREGLQGMAGDTVNEWLPWACRARRNPVTGEELAESARLERDPRYTVRAWMAVLTYLMSDYQFLYE